MRASRASTPSSVPTAPTTQAASSTPTSSRGRRDQGSPPVTPPTSTTMPNTSASAAPSASPTTPASATFAHTSWPRDTSPRRSRPIVPSSCSEAAAPAASRSERKVTVSAMPYDCTCAESTHDRPFDFGCASSIGLAVACSALPVWASASRAMRVNCRMRSTRALGGSPLSSFSMSSRPSTSMCLPRKLASPPCRIRLTYLRFASMNPACSLRFSW